MFGYKSILRASAYCPSTIAKDPAPNILVFLHGLGGTAETCLAQAVDFLEHSKHRNTMVVCPRGLLETGFGNSRAWYWQIKDAVIHTHQLVASMIGIKELMDNLHTKYPASNIMIAGFSQGGTMAVSVPILYPDLVSHVACFSGYIPDGIVVPASFPGKTKVFWGHGTKDAENPYFLAERGVSDLALYDVDCYFRAESVGHTVTQEGIDAALKWWLG